MSLAFTHHIYLSHAVIPLFILYCYHYHYSCSLVQILHFLCYYYICHIYHYSYYTVLCTVIIITIHVLSGPLSYMSSTTSAHFTLYCIIHGTVIIITIHVTSSQFTCFYVSCYF